MRIKEQLEVELSRWNTDLITNYVGSDPDRFKELWNLMIPENYPVSPRAAWVVEFICMKYPFLLKPYLEELLLVLPGIVNHGIKRHLVKILSYQIIPEKHLGNLIDLCFKWMQEAEIPVAVKVHSMQIIFNAIPTYPELKTEFIAVVEDQIPRNSVGFKSRGRRLIARLEAHNR